MATRGDYHTHEWHSGVFTVEECERILRLGAALEPERAGVEGDAGAGEDRSLRSATIAWVPADRATDWVFDRLRRTVEDANERYGFDLDGVVEDLQFTTYERPGAFYTWHQDGLDGPVAHRKLSVVVQLSDPADYEGADLELFQVVEDLDADELDEFRSAVRERGSALVFPAFEYHRVTELRSGVRHSLVAWFGGPPFR